MQCKKLLYVESNRTWQNIWVAYKSERFNILTNCMRLYPLWTFLVVFMWNIYYKGSAYKEELPRYQYYVCFFFSFSLEIFQVQHFAASDVYLLIKNISSWKIYIVRGRITSKHRQSWQLLNVHQLMLSWPSVKDPSE